MKTQIQTMMLIGISLLGVLTVNTALAQGDAAAGAGKVALCGSCHGPQGNSTLAENPKLAGQNASYLIKQLQDFKSGARTSAIMAPMAMTMSDQDVLDVSEYYAQQESTLEAADPESLEVARALYKGGNKDISVAACSACHSPTGAGNAPAGFPLLSGQHAQYTLAQLQAFRSGERNNDPNSMMRSVVERLTDAELEAVANYLSGLH